jgi:hypothetical protein
MVLGERLERGQRAGGERSPSNVVLFKHMLASHHISIAASVHSLAGREFIKFGDVVKSWSRAPVLAMLSTPQPLPCLITFTS